MNVQKRKIQTKKQNRVQDWHPALKKNEKEGLVHPKEGLP